MNAAGTILRDLMLREMSSTFPQPVIAVRGDMVEIVMVSIMRLPFREGVDGSTFLVWSKMLIADTLMQVLHS
jgi:hypothetical protein